MKELTCIECKWDGMTSQCKWVEANFWSCPNCGGECISYREKKDSVVVTLEDDYGHTVYGPFASDEEASSWVVDVHKKENEQVYVNKKFKVVLRSKNPYYVDGKKALLGQEYQEDEIGTLTWIGKQLKLHIRRDGH
jgi:hypothetical protein